MAIRIIWSAALLTIVAAVAWFILAPATTFMEGLGQDTQVGMLFIFICMPSIFFLILSSGQLMKSWYQSTGTAQIVWTALSCLYAVGLIAVLYFRFIA